MSLLTTPNLELRPCVPKDRNDFIDLERDPEVMRFLHGGAVDHDTVDPEKVTFLMPRGIEPEVWTASLIDTGEFVGWFCLFVENGGIAELGYRLRRDAWGKGYASEGASALVEWGFKNAGVDRIVACTMATNTGSRRVMEKIGMKYIRTVPIEAPNFSEADDGEVWYEVRRSQCLDGN